MIFSKPKYIPFLLASLYFLISIIALNSFIGIIDTDYYSYMSIARKYRAGEWYYALNDYWSPLISWLMAIGYCLSNNEMLVIKVLKVIFGTISLFYTYKILDLAQLRYKAIFIFIFSLLLFFYQFMSQTTDSLSLMMLILFIYFNISNKNNFGFGFVLKYSLLTIFTFFAKYYNLYFIILFTPAIYLYKNEFSIKQSLGVRKIISIASAYTLIGIFTFSWVLVNYTKTKEFTITSSSAYNLNLMNPKNHKLHPLYANDLKELPDKYSFSPLDYFPYKAKLEHFSFFSSRENLKFFFWYEKGQIRNFWESLYVELSPLILLLLVFIILKPSLTGRRLFILLFAFTFIYPAGYFLSFMVARYFMITNYLLLLITFILLSSLLTNKSPKISIPLTLAVSLFVIYFYSTGILGLAANNNDDKKLWVGSQKYTDDIANTNVAIYAKGRREALWTNAIAMAYFDKAIFMGQVNIKNYKSNEELTKKLLDYNINVYLTPEKVTIHPDSINYRLAGMVDSIAIYKHINRN